ncbi:unnamed protein product [Rotaria sordida]|uniref:Uncharacterized protein n=1 Tax=Rotaria sordida TaxID=392033 RepID=A0A815W998_9BILA|nr:unnamed protein product [Rotaria sordida]CAF1537980.1 unnamed protein product [Rotaria sordida]
MQHIYSRYFSPWTIIFAKALPSDLTQQVAGYKPNSKIRLFTYATHFRRNYVEPIESGSGDSFHGTRSTRQVSDFGPRH